jgi:hypothetical protein
LPAPLRPTIASVCPAPTVKLTPFNVTGASPYQDSADEFQAEYPEL